MSALNERRETHPRLGESNWEFGPYSPRTLQATTWIGAVVGGAPSALYFEWNGETSPAGP